MKTVFSILFVAVLLVGCSNQGNEISTDLVNNPKSADGDKDVALSAITFEEELFEFGQISQGEKVKHVFNFSNSGDADLIITSAKGSCGCTVPTWPKKPIPPGGKGELTVVFDSDGKRGTQHKKVTVVANTQPSTSIVALKGEVIAPETTEE